jgi:hypothetical protein
MLELASLLLAVLPLQPAAAAPPLPNRVEICSLVSGSCTSHLASALDPTARPAGAAGLVAFVDPRTGALVDPSPAQEREVQDALVLEEVQKASAAPQFEILPDGSRRARGDFQTYLRATLPAAGSDGDTPAPQERKP